MKQLLLGIVVLTLTFMGCKGAGNAAVRVISPEELQTLLKFEDMHLIDVRTPEEYKTGFIRDAENIDFYSLSFMEDISKLEKNKPIVIYCKSGVRSSKFGNKLFEEGFLKVYDLKGGISKWKHMGFKVNTKI